MVISSTSTVETSIQAVSPLSTVMPARPQRRRPRRAPLPARRRRPCPARRAPSVPSRAERAAVFKVDGMFIELSMRMRWPAHSASVSVSPVRMRTACSMRETKILPSPIWPVLAAPMIASTALSTMSAADGDLDLDLRQEAHGVFGAAIDFRMALLTPVALDFGDGQALDADGGERFAHLVELERLDDCHHDFHKVSPFAVAGPPRLRDLAGGHREPESAASVIQAPCQLRGSGALTCWKQMESGSSGSGLLRRCSNQYCTKK